MKAQCQVVLHFVTEDQTVIHPEGIELSRTELDYNLAYRFSGDTKSELLEKIGFGERDTLTAAVLPDLEVQDVHEPYNRSVLWESSDPEALSVENGKLTVKEDAAWIQEIMKQAPYQGQREVFVTARTEDGGKAGSCKITLNFAAHALEADRQTESFEIALKKTGRRSSPTYAWSGGEGKQFSAIRYPEQAAVNRNWTSSDSSVLTVSEEGFVAPVILDGEGNIAPQWLQNAAAARRVPKSRR